MSTGPTSQPSDASLDPSDLDIELLWSYWAGDASTADVIRIERWFAEKPGRHAWYESMRQGLRATPQRLSEPELTRRTTAVLEAVRVEVPAPIHISKRQRNTPRAGIVRRYWIASASVGLAILATVWGGMHTSPARISNTVTSHHATSAGQRASVKLAGGVTVQLAASTTLDVSREGSGPILATVQGEAFFTVPHQASSPFVVRIGSVSARVLGTSFSVRHYATDTDACIIVTEGRVEVTSVRARAIVPAGVLAHVDSIGRLRAEAVPTAKDYVAWTVGRLVFRDIPMSRVLADLGRAYDVDFVLADSALARERVRWTVVTEQQTLRDVLDELPILFDVHVKRSGRTVTISPGRGSTPAHILPSSPLTSEHSYGR
jgi:ferric-dicitrate binding protein FerR (iron transport regulator)